MCKQLDSKITKLLGKTNLREKYIAEEVLGKLSIIFIYVYWKPFVVHNRNTFNLID